MGVSQWDDETILNGVGISTVFGHDDDGRLVQHVYADVEPILDHNVRLQNQANNGFGPSREWRHIASIPLVLWHKWMVEEGVDLMRPEHEARLRHRLRDPEWRKLLTVNGRI